MTVHTGGLAFSHHDANGISAFLVAAAVLVCIAGSLLLRRQVTLRR